MTAPLLGRYHGHRSTRDIGNRQTPSWFWRGLPWIRPAKRSPRSRSIGSKLGSTPRLHRRHRRRSTRCRAGRPRPAAGGRAGGTGLPSSGQAFRTVAERQCQSASARQITMAKAEETKGQAEPSMREGGEATANATAAKMAAEAVPNPGRQIYLNEAKARIDAALGSEIGFAERLVWFWSNHFCISADNIQSMAGGYEREADASLTSSVASATCCAAVESHPAMLFYLDNTVSIGPNSGRRHQSHARPQREPRARNPRAAYARRAQRLRAGGRYPASPMC